MPAVPFVLPLPYPKQEFLMKFLPIAALLALAMTGSATAELGYWKTEDVKPGLQGTGRTVLKGNEIEEFQCTVLGVMKNVFPRQDMILVRLSGLNLEHYGIIEGMSGSPVYAEGKLLGAVAYGWGFSKEPIGGLTPAEQMMRLLDEPPAEAVGKQGAMMKPRDFRPASVRKLARLRRQSDVTAADARAGGGPPAVSASFRRLRSPLVIAGCAPGVFRHFSPKFERMGLLPVQGGGAGDGGDAAAEIQPGSPVAVSLIEGDMMIAGVGTVTERIGDRILAFGHPMMEMGRSRLPLATASIDAIMPSMYSSFKLSSIGKPVGTLLIDRNEGIYGRIGEPPAMVPLKVTMEREDFPGREEYAYRLADNDYLTPILVDISLYSSMLIKGDPPPEFTAYYHVKVTTDDNEVIDIRDMATSGSWWSIYSIFDAAAGTVGCLLSNPFKEVRVTDVQAEIDLRLGDASAYIDSVEVIDIKTPPGGSARVRVNLLRFREKAESIVVSVPIPADLPEGVYEVSITDSEGALQADSSAVPSRFDPRSYDEMLRLLRLSYAANAIYSVIHLPKTGIAIGGKELGNLPASALSMLTPVGKSNSRMITSVMKSSHPTDYKIIGSQHVQLVVEKED